LHESDRQKEFKRSLIAQETNGDQSGAMRSQESVADVKLQSNNKTSSGDAANTMSGGITNVHWQHNLIWRMAHRYRIIRQADKLVERLYILD
jgi:hypothetical protein